MVSVSSQQILVPLAIVAISAFFMGVYGFRKETTENAFKDRNLLKKGDDLPTIWLYYNTSDVNSRWWADFGARSTRVLNLPFLNLCYQTIVNQNKGNYKVEVISGLPDLASRLGGWQELPKPLQNPLASVREAELNWIRAEVLCRFGGLWVHPATICLKPFPELPQKQVVFFGTDSDESYNGSVIPNMYCMGAGSKEHPVFDAWAQAAFARLEQQGGGTQIRGDPKWDFTAFALSHPDTRVYPSYELSRLPNGKRIQLEDLLMAGQEGRHRFVVSNDTVYVPIPWPELLDRRMFGWFLRMDEEQILASDLAISDLFASQM
jgi:hypothetical protein